MRSFSNMPSFEDPSSVEEDDCGEQIDEKCGAKSDAVVLGFELFYKAASKAYTLFCTE
jgi:hypothetical protein